MVMLVWPESRKQGGARHQGPRGKAGERIGARWPSPLERRAHRFIVSKIRNGRIRRNKRAAASSQQDSPFFSDPLTIFVDGFEGRLHVLIDILECCFVYNKLAYDCDLVRACGRS